ncbi:MAG: cell division protein ZapA [Rhodocyclales bacterium]|nr:cell division protein ZapA [Rhodocyclales bacterium]
MTSVSTLDIKLQGRSYSVACPPEERDALLETVAFLDAKMADIATKTRSTGERLAVMTALNLAHELTALKKAPPPGGEPPAPAPAAAFDTPELQRRIQAMEARLDAVLVLQEDLF